MRKGCHPSTSVEEKIQIAVRILPWPFALKATPTRVVKSDAVGDSTTACIQQAARTEQNLHLLLLLILLKRRRLLHHHHPLVQKLRRKGVIGYV